MAGSPVRRSLTSPANLPCPKRFMLVNELSGNRDFFQNGLHGGPHSTYLYKDKGGPLYMGPGWDFDYETYISQSYIN